MFKPEQLNIEHLEVGLRPYFFATWGKLTGQYETASLYAEHIPPQFLVITETSTRQDLAKLFSFLFPESQERQAELWFSRNRVKGTKLLNRYVINLIQEKSYGS